jgi:hypothetical protein
LSNRHVRLHELAKCGKVSGNTFGIDDRTAASANNTPLCADVTEQVATLMIQPRTQERSGIPPLMSFAAENASDAASNAVSTELTMPKNKGSLCQDRGNLVSCASNPQLILSKCNSRHSAPLAW